MYAIKFFSYDSRYYTIYKGKNCVNFAFAIVSIFKASDKNIYCSNDITFHFETSKVTRQCGREPNSSLFSYSSKIKKLPSQGFLVNFTSYHHTKRVYSCVSYVKKTSITKI